MKKIIGLILVFLVGNFSLAGSLWSDDSQSLFQDRAAHRVGDIITIKINEYSSVNRSDNTEVKEQVDNSVEAGTGIFKFIKPFSTKGNSQWKGDGKIKHSSKLEAYLTATIVAKLPNGNFMVEGRKKIIINGEEQTLVITGVVRPDDINSDNEVDSKFLANATVKITGKGTISSSQKKGLITKIINFLF